MFATLKVNLYTIGRRVCLCIALHGHFFMHVTYLLYMAGSTIRAYIVMVYASLLCKDFKQRFLVDTRYFCIHTNA